MKKIDENYYISKNGYIEKRKKLKPSKTTSGYYVVTINDKQCYLHRLIWNCFNGEIPTGYEIDHINGDRTDNRLNNLRLVSHKENCNNPITKKRYSISNKPKGKKDIWKYSTVNKEKMVQQLSINGDIIECFDSIKNASEKTKIDKSSISKCCRGELETAGGYKWIYKNDYFLT